MNLISPVVTVNNYKIFLFFLLKSILIYAVSLRVNYKINLNLYARQELIWINVSFLTFHYVFNEITVELLISCNQMRYQNSANLEKKTFWYAWIGLFCLYVSIIPLSVCKWRSKESLATFLIFSHQTSTLTNDFNLHSLKRHKIEKL